MFEEHREEGAGRTVAAAVSAGAVGSIVDAVEPQIRELLQAYPTMPATVIAERIGWDRSIRVLRDRVAELRQVYLPPDPASRTVYRPGELAQIGAASTSTTTPPTWWVVR